MGLFVYYVFCSGMLCPFWSNHAHLWWPSLSTNAPPTNTFQKCRFLHLIRKPLIPRWVQYEFLWKMLVILQIKSHLLISQKIWQEDSAMLVRFTLCPFAEYINLSLLKSYFQIFRLSPTITGRFILCTKYSKQWPDWKSTFFFWLKNVTLITEPNPIC